MRLITIPLGILLVLGLVDRAAAYVVSRQIADRVQTSLKLSTSPSVEIDGFPFLTQVVTGQYSKVQITVNGLVAGQLRLARIHAIGYSATVPLNQVINGSLRSIPIQRGIAVVEIDYADLTTLVDRNAPGGIRIGAGGRPGVVAVTGSVTLPAALRLLPGVPRQLSATADAAIALSGNVLTVVPTLVTGLAGALPAVVRAEVVKALTFRVTLPALPFGIRVTAVQATANDIVLDATVSDLVVPVRPE